MKKEALALDILGLAGGALGLFAVGQLVRSACIINLYKPEKLKIVPVTYPDDNEWNFTYRDDPHEAVLPTRRTALLLETGQKWGIRVADFRPKNGKPGRAVVSGPNNQLLAELKEGEIYNNTDVGFRVEYLGQ